MAISGTYAFNPEIGDIVEEAFERAGLELRSGYDLRSARRSLNFLTLEWQNRGINLWTIDELFIDSAADGTSLAPNNYLLKDTATYRLATGTISLLDIVLRTNDGNANTQTDFQLNRISEPTFATIPNKLSSSRPLQFYLDRREILGAGAAGADQYDTVTFWPVPDNSTKYKVKYWRMKRISDTGDNAGSTMQVPARFLPALVSGLAYHIACKRPEVEGRIQLLKQQYEEVFREAAEEDRVKASVRFVPHIPVY